MVPLGIKWKVRKLPFHWYPLFFCGLSGLDTTATLSQALCQKVENAEIWPTLLSGETQTFFQMTAIPREIEILTWNQSQMRLKTPNFYGKKKLVDMSNHFWDISVWKVASSCTRKNQDGFPCKSRFPWLWALKCHISVSMFKLTTKRTKLTVIT